MAKVPISVDKRPTSGSRNLTVENMFVLVIFLMPIIFTKPLPPSRLYSGQLDNYFKKYDGEVTMRQKLHLLAKHG